MADLEKAIQLSPDDPEALYYRGYANYLKGDTDKAIADYDLTLKSDSHFAEAHFQKAMIALDKNDPEKALLEYKEVIGINAAAARRVQKLGPA